MYQKIPLLIFLCFLLGTALDAGAETVPAETLTLGWQTEHAEAVVLADLGAVTAGGESGRREVTFVVRERIRGEAKTGESLSIVFPDLGHGVPWVQGAKHLLFLRRIEGRPADAPVRWRPIPGTTGIRPIPKEGAAVRFPEMVREIAATLADGGAEVEEPAKLRSLLVGWLGDGDAGVVWSAATDLVRHRDLLGSLTESQRSSVVDAFRRHRGSARGALAMAAALTGHPDAGRALVDSLLAPKSRTIRGDVGDALVVLADPRVPAWLVAALSDADADHRATFVQVLGRVGGAAEAPVVGGRLRDDATAVRIEAAHAVGLIARRVRKDDADARVDARVELYRRVLGATVENELRACLWALAQLDDATAWENLRRLAADDTRPFVRRVAKQYLAKPRTSLELR